MNYDIKYLSCKHCHKTTNALFFSETYSSGSTSHECCKLNAGLDPKSQGVAKCCACNGTGKIIIN